MKRVYLFMRYERFRHWAQALLILCLAATGFEIHGTIRLLGFPSAIEVHECAGLGLLLLIFFTMLRYATTGEVRSLDPDPKPFAERVRFFTSGIFRSEPHPEIPTPEKSLSPVLRAAYFILLVLIFPGQITAGFIYAGTPFWPRLIDALGGLPGIALIHTVGACAMLAFVVLHLYLNTSLRTLSTSLRWMITGYADR